MSRRSGYDTVQTARELFGAELRRLRDDAKLTQEDVAAAIGGGDSTVSDLERGVGSRVPAQRIVETYLTACLRRLSAPRALIEERRRSLLDQYANLTRLIDYDREARKRHRTMPNLVSRVTDTLPRDVPQLVGRDIELRTLADAARPRKGPVPVHVVEGMPGIGKTALAVHAAHRLRDRFPDGRLFVPLYGHTPGHAAADPTDVLALLLGLDGLDATTVPASVEARTAMWRHRTADRRIVMIFDDAESFAQVEPLLPGSPASLIIVTTRHRLGVPGSVPLELGPLPAAEAEKLLGTVAGPRLQGPDELKAAAAHCGGLPLAIGIVASWLRAHRSVPVKELLDQIDRAETRPHVLHHGDRTVSTAFEVSYTGMPEGRRTFFRALGANPGRDVDAYAASALAGISVADAREHLEALFDQYLLEEIMTGRYRMHDLVAGYAKDLAAADPNTGAARDRLVAYYCVAATHAQRSMAGSSPDAEASPSIEISKLDGRRAAIAWLREERANVIATIHELALTGSSAGVLNLAAAYADYLRQYGPWDQAIPIYQLALATAQAVNDRPGKAAALLTLGAIQRMADEFQPSAESLAAALAEYEDLGDVDGLIRTRTALGATLWLLGEYDQSDMQLVAAVDAARHGNNQALEAAALTELGILRVMTDRYAEAATLLESAVVKYEDVGDLLGVGRALRSLGTTFYLSDHYPEARAAGSRALTIFKELDNPLGQAQVLVILGGVMRLTGDYVPAEAALTEAIELFSDMHKISSASQAMSELGALQGSTGRADIGERTLRVAVAMDETIDDRLGVPAALNQLGEVLRVLGRLTEADQVLLRAEKLYEALDDHLGLAAVANVRGAVLLDASQPEAARDQYKIGLQHAQTIGNPLEEGLAYEGLGRSAQALGEPDSLENLRRAQAIFHRIGAAEADRVDARLRDLEH